MRERNGQERRIPKVLNEDEQQALLRAPIAQAAQPGSGEGPFPTVKGIKRQL